SQNSEGGLFYIGRPGGRCLQYGVSGGYTRNGKTNRKREFTGPRFTQSIFRTSRFSSPGVNLLSVILPLSTSKPSDGVGSFFSSGIANSRVHEPKGHRQESDECSWNRVSPFYRLVAPGRGRTRELSKKFNQRVI